MNEELNKKIIEIAERIVIDYANLSGRESANRAEFRKRVIDHLADFVDYLTPQPQKELPESVKKLAESMEFKEVWSEKDGVKRDFVELKDEDWIKEFEDIYSQGGFYMKKHLQSFISTKKKEWEAAAYERGIESQKEHDKTVVAELIEIKMPIVREIEEIKKQAFQEGEARGRELGIIGMYQCLDCVYDPCKKHSHLQNKE